MSVPDIDNCHACSTPTEEFSKCVTCEGEWCQFCVQYWNEACESYEIYNDTQEDFECIYCYITVLIE